jgi:cytosine/adenosine deaminase-related metal-dependent hydrolase
MTCVACGAELPAPKRPGRRRLYCNRACRYRADPAKHIQRTRAWERAHRETVNAHRRAYYAIHREAVTARQRAYRAAHPEMYRFSTWRERHPESYRAWAIAAAANRVEVFGEVIHIRSLPDEWQAVARQIKEARREIRQREAQA